MTTSVVFRLEEYVITPVMPMKRFGKWERREEARVVVSVKQWMWMWVDELERIDVGAW